MLMRRTVAVLILVAVVALPAAAQFREAVPPARPSARLYEATGALGSVMSKIFNPSVFKMSHGFEMSAGAFGGRSYSMGMYTNTMAWQFSDKLAMRADVAVAYSPQNQSMTALGFERTGPRVFLRNAEIAWRPSEKFQLNIQVHQDPYAFRNPFMSPYGAYYGHRGYTRNPFWRDGWR